jgi:hypothetical protein
VLCGCFKPCCWSLTLAKLLMCNAWPCKEEPSFGRYSHHRRLDAHSYTCIYSLTLMHERVQLSLAVGCGDTPPNVRMHGRRLLTLLCTRCDAAQQLLGRLLPEPLLQMRKTEGGYPCLCLCVRCYAAVVLYVVVLPLSCVLLYCRCICCLQPLSCVRLRAPPCGGGIPV